MDGFKMTEELVGYSDFTS